MEATKVSDRRKELAMMLVMSIILIRLCSLVFLLLLFLAVVAFMMTRVSMVPMDKTVRA